MLPTIKFKFRFLYRAFGKKEFKLLDVGSGNASASITHRYFPRCKYYGLDITRDYNYTPADFEQMEDFYEVDLTKLDLSAVPDDFFDYIQMAHVVEHLHNGDLVLPQLLKKLKKGGYFYIEYPGKRSLKLPSMEGTLNFHDDPTHVRVYSVPEIEGIFKNAGCAILKSGTRRSFWHIALLPVFIPRSLLKSGKLWGGMFWDVLGFAEYVWARKA